MLKIKKLIQTLLKFKKSHTLSNNASLMQIINIFIVILLLLLLLFNTAYHCNI